MNSLQKEVHCSSITLPIVTIYCRVYQQRLLKIYHLLCNLIISFMNYDIIVGVATSEDSCFQNLYIHVFRRIGEGSLLHNHTYFQEQSIKQGLAFKPNKTQRLIVLPLIRLAPTQVLNMKLKLLAKGNLKIWQANFCPKLCFILKMCPKPISYKKLRNQTYTKFTQQQIFQRPPTHICFQISILAKKTILSLLLHKKTALNNMILLAIRNSNL